MESERCVKNRCSDRYPYSNIKIRKTVSKKRKNKNPFWKDKNPCHSYKKVLTNEKSEGMINNKILLR